MTPPSPPDPAGSGGGGLEAAPGPAGPGAGPEPEGPPPSAAGPGVLGAAAADPFPREFQSFLNALAALLAIGAGVWVIFAWSGYADRYARATECWHRGGRNFIEVTLVREDAVNLACAADASIDGLHCAFGSDQRPHPSPAADDAHLLRPYNTVNGQLFLGAGLWSSARMKPLLPSGRFTLWCDFEVAGALRTARIRWAADASFGPADKGLAVGTLRNCAIPE